MSIKQLFKNIDPFVYPYRSIIILTLILTGIGSFVGQVNALAVKYTVDSVNELVVNNQGIKEGASILIFVLVAFLGKEIINAAKKAYIHDQVMQMPKQYQTKALELSGE